MLQPKSRKFPRKLLCHTVHNSSLLSILLLSPVAAYAAADQVAGQRTLEEIVVTARKRTESLQDTPIAVSAFTGDSLERRQVTSVAQIERFTPSLVFDTSEGIGGGSSAQIFIRGVGQSDFNVGAEPGVGVYLDSVYIGRTPGANLDLMDLQQVEVLRGPQGTLFGRNTIGGAISLSSKKPSNEFGGKVDVTVGTDNRVDIKATVDIPLSDTFRTKFTGLSKKQDGYVRVLNTGQDLGDVDVAAARAAFEWEVSDTLLVDFTVDGTRQRQAGAATTGMFFDDTFLGPGQPATIAGFYNTVAQNGVSGAIPSPVAGRDIFGQALVNDKGNCAFSVGAAPNSDLGNPNCFNAQYDTGDMYTTYGSETVNNVDVYGVALTAAWDINDELSLKTITAYRDMDARFTNDIDNTPLAVGETENNIQQNQFSQELQLLGNYDRTSWVAGLYYFEESASDAGQITTGSGNFTNGTAVENEAVAVFGQVTYDVSEQLSVTIGGRYTEEKKSFSPDSEYVTHFFIPAPFFNLPENTTLANQYGCPTNPDGSGVCLQGTRFLPADKLSQDVSEFKPMINVNYSVTDDAMLYLSYSEGFKSGGGNQRAIFPEDDTSVLLYGPEFVEVYEAGFKTSWFERRLNLNGAAFYTDYKDIQINVQLGFVPVVQNAGDAEIKGFELELNALPLENLEVNASLAYLDAKYIKVADNAAITADHNFANTPELSGSLNLIYTVELPGGHALSSQLDWSYSSEIYNDADNNIELRQDDLSLINASVAFESIDEKWFLALNVSNLTDEKYLVAGFRNAVGGFGQGIVARQRQWSLNIQRRF